MTPRENPPLLSRVADAVYWMARYIERAENVARFIGVNHEREFAARVREHRFPCGNFFGRG